MMLLRIIHACNIALGIKPSWVMLDLDSMNAHTFCSWERLEEELELNATDYYMLESFRALYGKKATVEWHIGNGPDMIATSFHHLSCEELVQGDAPATVYFNVLATRVYKNARWKGSTICGGGRRKDLGTSGSDKGDGRNM